MASTSPPGPNPIQAAWSVFRSRRVAAPAPAGNDSLGDVDYADFVPVLDRLKKPHGLASIDVAALEAYIGRLTALDPDRLTLPAALAYWINLYNAAAIRLAHAAHQADRGSVLRVPGAFDRRVLVVAGEPLSLTDVEHGKIRRFKDPRIHAALVCGSLSCPTLRSAPFTGPELDRQLDQQMRQFLTLGGAYGDTQAATLHLSRIFLWYGADFVRPHRMPTWLPAVPRRIALAATPWMEVELADWVRSSRPKVVFQPYDWALGCTVA